MTKVINEKLEIHPDDHTQYSRVDWKSKEGDTLMAVQSHVLTNVKNVNGQSGRYRHSHNSIYTRTSSGGLEHALDITHSEEGNEIHLQLPVFLKNKGAVLIIRASDNKYYKIDVIDGEIKAVPHKSPIKANKEWIPLEQEEN